MGHKFVLTILIMFWILFMSFDELTAEQKVNESVSALMDGEASDIEMRRVLKSEDAALDKRWQRYQLVGAAIRKESDLGFASIDLSVSISRAIANEPGLTNGVEIDSSLGTEKLTVKDKVVSLWSNIGRFAVAASVAGAVVVGVQFSPNDLTSSVAIAPEMPVAPVSGQPVLDVDTTVRAVGTQAQAKSTAPIIINEATQQQVDDMKQEVNRLILEHAENATQNTQNGVTPFVRVPDAE
jgi:sigma-E factor negative regulatory protein RseA